MRKLLATVSFVALAASAEAQYAGRPLGAGFIVGDPTGLTAKYWLSGSRALQLGLGADGGFVVTLDHLWHAWDPLRNPPGNGRIAGYLGLGAKAGSDDVAVRGLAGASWFAPRHPFEVFLELGPAVELSKGSSDMDLGLGLRYYFGGLPSRRR